MAASAISAGVIGRWGDMVGVWIAPVTAQVMMTLPCAALMKRLSYQVPCSGVHRERLTGDVPARGARQVERHVGDFLGAHGRAHAGRLEKFLQEGFAANAQHLGLRLD